MPLVIGGDNLPSPVGIGLTDLPNIGGASGPPGPPGSGTTDLKNYILKLFQNLDCFQSNFGMVDAFQINYN